MSCVTGSSTSIKRSTPRFTEAIKVVEFPLCREGGIPSYAGRRYFACRIQIAVEAVGETKAFVLG